MNKDGLLIVLSGPSGTGKGTICQKLFELMPGIVPSVSVTTRAPRAGETEGVSYFFRTREEYDAMVAADAFLEHATVFDNCYGTPKDYVFSRMAEGRDVLLEIDIQGALNVKKSYADAVMIFILPPSMKTLKERLVGRGTETPEVVEKRFSTAYRELTFASQYDYCVINDDLDQAVQDVCAILSAERSKMQRNNGFVEKLLKEDNI